MRRNTITTMRRNTITTMRRNTTATVGNSNNIFKLATSYYNISFHPHADADVNE